MYGSELVKLWFRHGQHQAWLILSLGQGKKHVHRQSKVYYTG